MTEFQGFYFVCETIGTTKMKVKYGDTRWETDLVRRYSNSYYLKETVKNHL